MGETAHIGRWLIALAVVGCESPREADPPRFTPGAVVGILDTACAECHAGESGQLPRLDVDPCRLVGRRSPSDKARDVVVEGDHAASTLWSTLEPVEGDEQPVRHAIDARYLDTIAGWIDAGAACLVEPGPRSFAFSTVQSEVLNDLCIGCHFAPPRPEFANLVLDQGAWSTLVEGPDPYVVPGDPEGSLLYMKLMGTQSAEDGERMPPLETLTTEQLTLVYGWILEGAAP